MLNLEFPPTIEAHLMHLGHAHRRLVESHLQEIGLYRGQPPLLYALSHQDGLSNAELAHLLRVTTPTISNMVKRMQQAGFVEKRRDVEDERVTRVYLTDQGRDVTVKMANIIIQINDLIGEGLSAEEKALLIPLLRKMTANIENALQQVAK